jgi:6-phosphogluconate dehydrogenase
MARPCQWGVVGMGVMGQSLALNLVDHAECVVVWDRDAPVLAQVGAEHAGPLLSTEPSLEGFVGALERPRRILLMITAGPPVDAVLGLLGPLLSAGDVVIDGGNSWFEDTSRRQTEWAARGIHLVGMGVSGGEQGARHGPSLMPGGATEVWELLRPTLQAIAADADTGPCVTWVGPGGAGHFVKMVHNGIEYAEMQALAEVYHLLRDGAGLGAAAIADLMEEWSRTEAEGFLLETTVRVLRRRDPVTGGALVDQVLDKAGQKGTGRWTLQVALEHGVAVPSLAAALDARVLSSLKEERVQASRVHAGPAVNLDDEARERLKRALPCALYASRVGIFAQGLALIRTVSDALGWGVDLAEVLRVWRGGCIIRGRLLTPLRQALRAEPSLLNLMASTDLAPCLQERAEPWREAVTFAVRLGIPAPVLCSTLCYFDAYRSAWLPQNLTQAQRDAFGAHTYERVDQPGVAVHSDWG